MARVDRRTVLTGGAAFATVALPYGYAQARAPTTALTPFTLGVAAGDPAQDGFVIWTRLAPVPLAPDGRGGLSGPVDVRWEVSGDESFRRVVQRGHGEADARFAHSVHVEVAGLTPGRPYWYRFTAQGHQSPIGRAVTAPARDGQPLKVVAASCAHWELGWFSAYRHMAAESPDLVLFLGDYIYEYSYRSGDRQKHRAVRQHDREADIVDLAGYRNRYAQYKTDADLQALHASAPCLMTWDDHEVQNDYANRWSQNVDIDVRAFLARRAAAYQAFYEHMPLRARSRPRGPNMRIYDRLAFGDLAEFTVLDGRQYRSVQPCPLPKTRRGHVAAETCPDLAAPQRTMLGKAQESWMYEGFKRGRARWTIIVQDLLVAPLLQQSPSGLIGRFTDGWDGYQANRERMLTALAASGAPNPVFIGGDIHSFWATDVKVDARDPNSRTIATEFVGGAIAQEPPPAAAFKDVAARNPHIRYVDLTSNGYVSMDIGRDHLETRFRAISDRRDPAASASTLQRFIVEGGRPGVVLA